MKLISKSFLVAAFAFSLVACGDSSTKSDDNEEIINPPLDTIPVNPPTDNDTVIIPPVDTISPVEELEFSIPEEALEIKVSKVITKDSGKGILIDDFEDGDNVSLIGQYWYSYNDNNGGNDGDGASIILTPQNEAGDDKARRTDNGSNYAWAVYYKLDKGEYKYDPYVGWGITLPDSIDYSRFGGITYWYKGGAHEIHIETSDVTDYDYHLETNLISRGWSKVTVRFKDLTQGGWGKEVDFNPANMTAISFQAKGKNKIDSVLIDNIYLQDTSEVKKDSADMTIKDPLIPEVTIGDISINTELQTKAMKYLNKGINITNWLEENGTIFKGTFKFDESDIKLMADNGIKSLRFPIDLDQYVTNRDKFVAGTETELIFDDNNLFTVLDSFAEWTKKHNMSFVIDYHEYDNGYNTKTATKPLYTKMMAELWKHVASHFASNEREDIFYELLNEPDMTDGKVTSANWRKAAQEDIDSIRTVDKKHTIIFGDASWYSISYLVKGEPLNDDNIIYAIHTYDPFVFTHQGADWTDAKTIKNLTFPYNKDNWSKYSADFGIKKTTKSWISQNVKDYYKLGSKESILSIVLPAKEWAVKNQVPVIINEFGAYRNKSDETSVLNYLTALREISDTLQIPLQHWGYTGGFSLFESSDGIKGTKLYDGIKEAYGLE